MTPEVHLSKILLPEAAFQYFSIKLLFEFYGRYFFEKAKYKFFNQLLIVSSYTHKGIKFLKGDKLGTGLRLNKKPFWGRSRKAN